MDPVTSLKVVVFPSLEDKIIIGEKRGFCPASTSAFRKSTQPAYTLWERQPKNGERIDSRKLPEERKNFKNKRQFSCPSIIDFNTLKSYQEIRPMHKPNRIFNGFFPSRVVRSGTNAGLASACKEGQEVTLEELVPNPNIPPCYEGAVLSRTTTSRNSSLRSEPIALPNDSEPPRLSPGTSPPQCTKQNSRRVVYSLRNGSPSPWVDRYKLKQKSISASTYVELRNKNAKVEEPPVRGFSR